MYLGAKLCKIRLHNGVWAWALRLVKYIPDAIRNCKAHLVAYYSGKFRLPKKAENPFKIGYNPKLNVSQE